MKFSEMTYTRPDYPAVSRELEGLTQRLQAGKNAAEQAQVYREYETLLSHLTTQTTLCYIRHSVDTRNTFYEEEQATTISNLLCWRKRLKPSKKPW